LYQLARHLQGSYLRMQVERQQLTAPTSAKPQRLHGLMQQARKVRTINAGKMWVRLAHLLAHPHTHMESDLHGATAGAALIIVRACRHGGDHSRTERAMDQAGSTRSIVLACTVKHGQLARCRMRRMLGRMCLCSRWPHDAPMPSGCGWPLGLRGPDPLAHSV
jgi:hypothetical protein